MNSSLLATRLRVPTRPSQAVDRSALLETLERGVPLHRLTLVSAPAGYGKTTLLAQWAQATRNPVAWLSLGDGDDDPDRFLRYLLKAWEAVQPDVTESSLGLLLSSASPDHGAVLSAFSNLASERTDHLTFVIDDIHIVEDPTIHEALTFVIDNLPPSVHFVLSGRSDPPLPLARYRARGELLELRPEDLRFNLEESARFLSNVFDLTLSNDQLISLHERLEGWPAGLQLAGLSLRRAGERVPEHLVSGRHRYIADYLAEDVLDRLPDDECRFLLRTSILSQLSAPLCDRVTGETGGQEMLERLERKNLFIVPLDDRRKWFRYHRVFADFLRETLRARLPEEVPELHRRAARWYMENDEPNPALEHAIAASDPELAVAICDLYTQAKLLGGELRVVGHWLEQMQGDWFDRYPILGLVRAGFLAYSGDVAGCLQCIDEVEGALSRRESDGTRWQMTRVLTIRCFIACQMNDVEAAERFADQAIGGFDPNDQGFLPGIFNALGDTYRRNGRWDEARASYLRALEFERSPGVRVQSAHIHGALADLNLQRGLLHAAERDWQRALSAIDDGESWGVLPLPVIGWIYIRLAEIHYERNRLDLADEYLTSGLDRVELGGDVRAMIAGYVLSGRLALARGDLESADRYRAHARERVEESAFHEWISRFERFQLDLWIAEDRLRAAVDWSDTMLEDDTLLQRPENEPARLAMARALIIRGDTQSIRRGMDLLEDLLHEADEDGRTGLQIEALALQSLGYRTRNDDSGAMRALERALRLAEPEGYVRTFLDLGLPMVRALQEARSREILTDYVGMLLSASDAIPFPEGSPSPIPEALSEREQEILEFLAAGLTNQEIAERLFISPETVKKHAGNIYGKLDVRSRTAAVARARSLELLK